MIDLLNDDPGLFLFILAMGALVNFWFCGFIIRITLDPRVRRALPRDKVYDNFPDWYFGLGRAVSFASAAIFPWVKNSDYMQRYYNGFDVYAFADKFEKTIGWIMALSISITLLSLISIKVGGWLGYWSYD